VAARHGWHAVFTAATLGLKSLGLRGEAQGLLCGGNAILVQTIGSYSNSCAIKLPALFCRERGEMAQKLVAARREGRDGSAAVREATAAQRALKGVWFQQVSSP